jgi:ubiquinone/menaquinone biosynthesis C-methylase UbiE
MSHYPHSEETHERPESNEEAYRRFMTHSESLHHYVTLSMGSKLYPDRIPVTTMQRVLELGCRSGEWLFDLAKQHPRLRIYGIDTDEAALQLAKMRRNLAGFSQIELRLADSTTPLPIPDNYIDLVHMRFRARMQLPSQWPTLLQEMARILKPGGWLFILDIDYFELSSPAFMHLHRAMMEVMIHMNRTMDHSGVTFGVAQRVPQMLIQAGFEDVAYDLYIIDAGFMGGTAGRTYMAQVMNYTSYIKPFIVQSGVLSATAFDALVEQQKQELQDPDLCGWGMLISSYGRKSSDTPEKGLL